MAKFGIPRSSGQILVESGLATPRSPASQAELGADFSCLQSRREKSGFIFTPTMRETRYRYINSGIARARENMAIDEALFRSFQEDSCLPILRFYQWEPSSLSLGYFQEVPPRVHAHDSYVRRFTGGKAVLHHDDFSFTVITKRADARMSIEAIYRATLGFLIDAYARLKIDAHFVGVEKKIGYAREPQWCYSSQEPYDIVIGGKKIGGACIRKSAEAVFIHGFIPFTIGLETMAQLVSRDYAQYLARHTTGLRAYTAIDAPLFTRVAQEAFGRFHSCDFAATGLYEHEARRARELLQAKYDTASWNERRCYGKERKSQGLKYR